MLKNFQLHIDASHFPGYKVTKPFWAFVQYEIKDGKFNGITSVTIVFSAIGVLNMSSRFKDEIEAAALNNFESLYKVTKTTGELNGEEIKNLKSQITY